MDQFSAINLQCIKQDRELFAELNFEIQSHDVLFLTGSNGAGKTSLLRLLAGLSSPQAGEVQWNGMDITECREDYNESLLYLGHKLALNSALSAIENLRFWLGIQGISEAFNLYQLLAQLGLAGFEDLPVAHLSAGQQKRVSLSRIWLKPSRLMILDEPFNALDKDSRERLETKLLEHTQAGGMLIITSHWQLPGSFNVKNLHLEYQI